MIVFLKSGAQVTVADSVIASGAEGEVRNIVSPENYKDSCVKIYYVNKRSSEKERKLSFMVDNPPSDLRGNGYLIAWPLDIVYNENKEFIGFVMPLADPESKELVYLTSTKISNKLSREWHQRFDRSNVKISIMSRLKLMKNIAIPLYQLHATGKYVLGDFKPQNVLVTYSGKIILTDLDSIQIADKERVLFPLQASTDFYMPPECFTQSVGQDKTVPIQLSWDYFSIGVVFYQLLFGLPPYVVTPKNITDDASYEIPQNIAKNLFAFGDNAEMIESFPKLHNNFLIIPKEIQNLFKAAFSSDPAIRPSAKQWGQTLHAEIQKHQDITISESASTTTSASTSTSTSTTTSTLKPEPNPVPKDGINGGLCFLSFFLPIVGWILWWKNRKDFPQKAQACGIWAWVGAVISIMFFVIPLIGLLYY